MVVAALHSWLNWDFSEQWTRLPNIPAQTYLLNQRCCVHVFSTFYKLNLCSGLYAVAVIKTHGSIKCHKSCRLSMHSPGYIKINKQRPRLNSVKVYRCGSNEGQVWSSEEMQPWGESMRRNPRRRDAGSGRSGSQLSVSEGTSKRQDKKRVSGRQLRPGTDIYCLVRNW